MFNWEDAGGFLTRGTTFWTDVFVRHFLFQLDRSIDADDLLFFVRKKHIRTTLTMPKFLVKSFVQFSLVKASFETFLDGRGSISQGF